MRRLAAALLLAPIVAALAPGCPSTIKEETYPLVDSTQPAYESDRSMPYEEYLILMDGGQRQVFFDLNSEDKRKRFLNEQGLVVKKMLNDNLRRDMTRDEVESVLGAPEKEQMEDFAHFSASQYDRLVDEWWIYQETGSGNLVFLPFKEGWLVDWLLEKKTRDLVFMKAASEKEYRDKQGLLIHLQEEIPSLLRLPNEELDAYKERLRKIAPVVFSESPPSFPDKDYARELVPESMYTKFTKRDVYVTWGKTAKIFEIDAGGPPELPFEKISRWVYKVFNGRDYTFYCVNFHNGKLVDWDVGSNEYF